MKSNVKALGVILGIIFTLGYCLLMLVDQGRQGIYLRVVEGISAAWMCRVWGRMVAELIIRKLKQGVETE